MSSQTAEKSPEGRGAEQSGPRFTSRAVARSIEAGSATECTHCGGRVKFQAKVRAFQVICNVYIDGRWDRVEHYHDACYKDVGEPYGSAAAA
jgi:hypothetical protein